MAPKKTLWKKYLRTAQKVLLLVKEHEFDKADFDVRWLGEVAVWIEEKQFVTDAHRQAIDNVLVAVKNMIRYKKLSARRKRGQA